MMSALLVQPGWSPMARAFAFGLALLTLAASGVSAQTVTWLGTTSSDWNIPDNWSPAGIPGVTADVIVPAAAPAITISTANVTVQSLTLGRGLTLGGGRTLTVTTANLSAPITLAANAGLSGGTYTISSGGNLTFPGSCTFGRLSNLTINGDLGISGASIRWNNVVHNGTLTASGTGTSRIAFEGNQTLSSTIISNISGGELRIEQATAGTLTIASTGAIRGGNVTFGPACIGGVGAVINNGTILANTAGRSIDFAANTPVTNTGTITAGPGNITIGGALTNSGTVTSGTGTVTIGGAVTNTGTINSTGGSVVINGNFNPFVGTLTGTNFTFGGTIDLGGNTWNLAGRTYRITGTLQNGTVDLTGGGNLSFAASCTFGRLSNLTIDGDLSINGTSIRWNNVVHNGTLTASGTNTSRIAFEGNQTLSSTIISNISGGELRIEQATAGTLTIASTGAIRGGNVTFGPACIGGVGAVINNGTILANTAGRSIDFAANTPVTNTGTITAGPGNITIGGALTNSGTVTSGTGTVTIGGAVTNTGTINSTGGSVVINGNFNPFVGTLTGTNFTFGGTIDLGGNTWNLAGRTYRITGTLQNGTVDLTGGGSLSFAASCTFGRLSNLTIDGDLSINGTSVRWNNVVHNGTLTASGTNTSRIAFEGNQTLSSTIISNISGGELRIEQATAGTLTIASTGALRGGNITVGASCFGINAPVINNGTIEADLPGRSITFAAGTPLTNNGTISAPAGNVNINGTLTGYDAATRTLSGGLFSVASTGRLQLGSPTALTIRAIAAGTVVIVDGPSASLVNSALANVLPDLASVAGSLSLVNRSAAITPSGGTLAVTGSLTLDRTLLALTGSYNQSPAGNLTVSVYGTTPAEYGRITATGAAAVAGTITAQPASGFFPLDTDSFNIITAANVSGTFSTLVGANGYIPIPSYTPTLARINFASCPFVITQPAAVTACAAGEGSFGVGAIGQPPLAYQWEIFNAGSWAPLTDGPLPGIGTIVNAQSDVLTIQNPETTGFQVRVVINNNCGSVTSDPASLTLPPPCSVADVVGIESGASVCADGNIDGADFIAFINSFSIGDATIDPAADVAGGGTGATPDPDGTIDGGDFIAFINAFAIGC